MSFKASKYTIWMNYDNDKKQYQVPMNPESIQIKIDGKAVTSDIDRLGTLLHKGKRGPMQISWSSYFPATYGSYCTCQKKNFKSPQTMHKWILALMNAANPLHLVFSGAFSLNIYAVITSYTATEEGGDVGTISYSITLKEYRSVTIKKYTQSKTKKKAPAKQTKTKKRVNNTQKKKTYKIKQGDCLWNIAKRYYGDGKKCTKIYNANKSVLNKAAKKHGYSNCRNGNLIFPGTTITIP